MGGESSAEERSDSSFDAVFRVLVHEHRRSILDYLADRPEKTVDRDGIVDCSFQIETTDADYDALELLCHHFQFPRTHESGLVEHDAEARSLRILRASKLEAASESVEEMEEKSSRLRKP